MTNPTPCAHIYIPSKGRWDTCLTALFLQRDNVPFSIVVEPQEYDQYAMNFDNDCILVLPFSNQGSVVPARNWIKEHSIANGETYHWQLDDNIEKITQLKKGKFTQVHSRDVFTVIEEFVYRYNNIAITGISHAAFVRMKTVPFDLNKQVYCCILVNNSIPYNWRGKYSEDTDMSLQVLTGGWCTIRFNIYAIHKVATMVMKGGNTDEIYQGDGKLQMARSLQRQWPGIVKITRRFGIPRMSLGNVWSKFDTKPIRISE